MDCPTPRIPVTAWLFSRWARQERLGGHICSSRGSLRSHSGSLVSSPGALAVSAGKHACASDSCGAGGFIWLVLLESSTAVRRSSPRFNVCCRTRAFAEIEAQTDVILIAFGSEVTQEAPNPHRPTRLGRRCPVVLEPRRLQITWMAIRALFARKRVKTQPTIRPTKLQFLYDFRVFRHSPRCCKLL